MELAVSPVAPKSRKRPVKRLATYIVVHCGRVVFEHGSMSAAFAWRDGFGGGVVFERVPTPRKAVRL